MKYKFPRNPKLSSIFKNAIGLKLCPVCKGRGSDPKYDEINSIIYKIQIELKRDEPDIFIMNCQKCKGDGYLDWIENTRGKIISHCQRPIMKDIRETCIYFLYSCLIADQQYTSHFINSNSNGYSINFSVIFSENPNIFYKSIVFVDKYLLPEDRRMFFMGLHRWMIMNGYACTNCFKFIPSEYFITKHKRVCQRIAMTPEIDMNYWELFSEESKYPIFILCDKCFLSLNPHQIDELKQEAFDSNDPYQFSNNFDYKILYYLYYFYKDKYFDNYSSYLNMEI
jgi:hypothetical protein